MIKKIATLLYKSVVYFYIDNCFPLHFTLLTAPENADVAYA